MLSDKVLRSARLTCVVAVALGAHFIVLSAAQANSEGIFGQSGRQNSICTSCHAGGEVPTVEFEAPQGTQMSPGATATFRFRIISADPGVQTHAGFDVAPNGGSIAVVDPIGTHIPFPGLPDITHRMPRPNDGNGVAVFEFSWQAPATPGTYRLFGAGNSVNLNGESGGDNASSTTIDIGVVAAETPTPTPTVTATPGSCTGDCDGSGNVTVDEIVRGVNIALGDRPVEDCPAFDRDGDGVVTVDEIVEAIGNALAGCD
jgi:hypothetical protein